MKKYILLCLLSVVSIVVFSQNKRIEAGIRVQKNIGLYWENGVTLQYADSRLLKEKLLVGFSYYTSRLGSAINSNAIKQDNFVLTGTYLFSYGKWIMPTLGLQAGYFHADYGDVIFDGLDQSSPIFSMEAGVSSNFKSPFRAQVAFGYNFISGDGEKGAGTLYPYYIQTTFTWAFKVK